MELEDLFDWNFNPEFNVWDRRSKKDSSVKVSTNSRFTLFWDEFDHLRKIAETWTTQSVEERKELVDRLLKNGAFL